jgi:hypothetical protein
MITLAIESRIHLGDTWIEPIDMSKTRLSGGVPRHSSRRGLVRFPDGKLRTVTLGDTYNHIAAQPSHGRVGYVFVHIFNRGATQEYAFSGPHNHFN